MSNKTASLVLCLALFATCLAATPPDESEPTKTATTPKVQTVPLPKEVSATLEEMLKMIDQGKYPDKDEVAAVGDLLTQNKKNLLKFDEPGKTKYYMLSAWANYFGNNADGAVQAILAGIKSGPEDPDMKATYAAVAIGTEKYPLVLKLASAAKKPATPKKRRNMEDDGLQSGAMGPAGTLTFDAGAFKAQATGKKLAVVGQNYDCIGGTTFNTGKGDMLCLLAYRTVSSKPTLRTAATTGSSEDEFSRSSSPSDSDPAAAFAALASDYMSSGKAAFAGVCMDDAAAAYNAVKHASDKGWFWPQIMAQEGGNKSLTELAKFDVTAPTMVIVKRDGTVTYMGSPTGFLPKMLLAKGTDGFIPRLYAPPVIDPNARRVRAVDPNIAKRRTADPNAPHQPRDPNAPKVKSAGGELDEAIQMGSDIQAETLYNHARSYLKGSKTRGLTAGNGIQLCREILQKYGNTEYAGKARELLRELPDEIKTRYNITNAEMGL